MTQRHQAAVPRSRIAMLTVGAAVSFAALAWSVAQRPPAVVEAGAVGNVAEEHDDPTKLDGDGRFTGPGDVWPPQPRNATDVVVRSFGDLEAEPQAETLARVDARATGGQSPSVVVAADQAASDAIGATANLIAVEESDGSTQLVYYSLSNNHTVDMIVSGGEVVSLETIDPTVFQPELSQDEKLAAIEVARAFWEAKGDPRIDTLQGFSILAFQPGGAYYDTRMVYVSFHIDEDSRPELLTWVDLAAGEITKSEVER